MSKNAFSPLGMLTNLKRLGASRETLLDVWVKFIRCLLELAAPVWCNSITEAEMQSLESVQAVALAIILDKEYTSYRRALVSCNMPSLQRRYQDLFIKFCKKTQDNGKFQHWLNHNQSSYSVQTRQPKLKFKPVPCNSKQFAKSAIPRIVDEINRINLEKS